MICKGPISVKGEVFRCGQCMPCRIKRRREWTHRLVLESLQHKTNAFITLTYDDDNLPEDGSVVPEHGQLFMKRLRKRIEPRRVRFFLVGEYGDETERPHYHVALFNSPECENGRSRHNRHGLACCDWCHTVRDVWGKGHIDVGELNSHSAQYLAGYTTKKLTRIDDTRLKGRHPEFARMSNRPGIGALAADDVASELLRFDMQKKIVDVPVTLRTGGKELPLDRYMRQQLRVKIGRKKDTPDEALAEHKEKMRDLRERAKDASAVSDAVPYVMAEIARKEAVQKVRNIEVRSKIFKQRKKI